MALTETTVLDQIEVTERGSVQVRRQTRIVDDATGRVVMAGGYHRTAYDPGMDLSHEDALVQAIAAAAWTPEVIAAHQARMEAGQG